jgi:hypothetical protein
LIDPFFHLTHIGIIYWEARVKEDRQNPWVGLSSTSLSGIGNLTLCTGCSGVGYFAFCTSSETGCLSRRSYFFRLFLSTISWVVIRYDLLGFSVCLGFAYA